MVSGVGRVRRPERIVVGVDGSIASRAAIRWALDHAHPGDEVVLLHIWQPSRPAAESPAGDGDEHVVARAFVEREARRAKALLHGGDVTLSCEARRGDPRAGLAAEPADLLVVGAGRHGHLTTLFLPSVSAGMSKHCAVPLVLVPCPSTRRQSASTSPEP